MDIYFVRHGQVDSNLKKVYNYEGEKLNENGIRQANQLREKIKEIKYDLIIASPLPRTKQTAEIININNKKIIFDDRLEERKTGDLAGKDLESIDREEYWNYYSDMQYGSSENIRKFFERVYEFINELKNKDYKSIIIVAHNGVSKAFYTYFNGMPENGKLLKIETKNTEVVRYYKENNNICE